MKIKEIMTSDVITVERNESIVEVAKILRKNKIHGLPVVEGKRLVGIITETDFFIKGEQELYLPSYVDFLTKTGLALDEDKVESEEFDAILKAKVGDIMTTECVTLTPESDVKDFLKIIREKDLHTVPVVSGGILEGIVSVDDVIKLI